MGTPDKTAAEFGVLAGKAGDIADELRRMQERVVLTDPMDRAALDQAIASAHQCEGWCGLLRDHARKAAAEAPHA